MKNVKVECEVMFSDSARNEIQTLFNNGFTAEEIVDMADLRIMFQGYYSSYQKIFGLH